MFKGVIQNRSLLLTSVFTKILNVISKIIKHWLGIIVIRIPCI